MSLAILFGTTNLNSSFVSSSYHFNEFWIIFISFHQFSTVYTSPTWKKLVTVYISILGSYVILLRVVYGHFPLFLLINILSACTMSLLSNLAMSKQIKETLQLLKDNKELIQTIKTILQVFPEGVVIRTLDESTKRIVTKFANEVVSNFIWKDENPELTQVNVIPDADEVEEQGQNGNLYKFEDFLKNQEVSLKAMREREARLVERMIEIKHKALNLFESENFIVPDHIPRNASTINRNNRGEEFKLQDEVPTVYNVKTIKVNWTGNTGAYLHVFINTTEVRK